MEEKIEEENNSNNGSSKWMIGAIVVLVGLIIYSASFIQDEPTSTNNFDSSTLACIADNSQLYVSEGCSYCAQQKEILGEEISLFDIIDCRENPQSCVAMDIQVVPTWNVNGTKVTGVHSLEKLKELTGC